MKKLLIFLCAILICVIAKAHTINWHVGDQVISTTTCDSGDSITPPNAPEKYGYHFKMWLPYTQIEYLESSGTQYIDTGVLSNNQNEIFTIFSITDSTLSNAYNYVFGVYNKDFGRTQYSYSATAFYGWGANYLSAPINLTTEKHRLTVNRNEFVLDDIKQYTPSSDEFSRNANIYLFARNAGGVTGSISSGVRIWGLRILTNNVLIRDFIPVLDPSGTPCMYDKVTQQYFYNAGTGQFIAGPVLNE